MRRVETGQAGTPEASISIYRPFFTAGIVCVLTAGCLLGAIALLGISIQGSYVASAWTPYVLAHANSQLFGWVGFFVMGFTFQMHRPRPEARSAYLRAAWTALILMAIGIGARFAAEPLTHSVPGLGLPLGIGSCALQAVAVLVFIVGVAFSRADRGSLTWQTAFIFASLIYLAAVALVEPFYFAASHAPVSLGVQAIAHWAPILREAQFLGFVANMIFGVSLMRLGAWLGFAPPSKVLGLAAFGCWNAALLLRLVGWNAFFLAGLEPGLDRTYRLGGILLAMGAILAVLANGVFDHVVAPGRSQKFIRAAYAWLLVAGLMVLAEPFYLSALALPFSHAYTGAIRHALTVGFISQMIVGFSLHVSARMNDLPEQGLRRLWLVFALLNFGNLARVALEVASDSRPGAFILMAPTGFIELTALAIWAVEVLRTLFPRRRLVHAG